MQKCIYKNNPIYAFDILYKNKNINFELEKEYRFASQQKLLTCCDCGAPIIFKFKNLDKMIPHFSHYNSDSNQGCGYGKESEEHLEGKIILLDHMRKSYPDSSYEMRHHIKDINRYADLYFELNDEKLIIEFQRTDLDINTFDEKVKDYKSLNINMLWILSEDENSLDDIKRNYNLPFFSRLVLESFNNRLLFLNFKRKEITILSKITYINHDLKIFIPDKIIHKTYSIDNITINFDSTITSDFEIYLKIEKDKMIKEYEQKLKNEKIKKENQRKILENRDNELKQRILNNKINRRYQRKEKNTGNSSSPTIDSMYYIHKRHIEAILCGKKQFLIDNICEAFRNNLDLVDTIVKILNEEIEKGNEKAKLLLEKFISCK